MVLPADKGNATVVMDWSEYNEKLWCILQDRNTCKKLRRISGWLSTYFEQEDGAAIGSPLSPIITNLYMESFEKRALKTAHLRPNYGSHMLTMCMHEDQQLRAFHEHLNSQHPAIHFMVEEEVDGKISFLIVTIERHGNKVQTSVFHKKTHTHTHRYINYNSHHHPRTPYWCCEVLENQSKGSMPPIEEEDICLLEKAFQANGFPGTTVQKDTKCLPQTGPQNSVEVCQHLQTAVSPCAYQKTTRRCSVWSTLQRL